MANKRKPDTLRQQLIQSGIDISLPDFITEENERVQIAMDAIPRPVNPVDDAMPENFQRVAKSLHAFGRIGTLFQVVLISGGIGPVINIGLIFADTVRINHAIAFFEHSWFVALLLSVVTIFSYTYLSFVKSDLKYLLRKNERELFSLRRVSESMRYWLGSGKEWQPRRVTQTEAEYSRVSGFYRWFKMGIFILLFLSSLVTVLDDSTKQPDRAIEHVSGAIGSVIITMLLLSALDLQIDRSYKAFMQTDGLQVTSADFFGAELERWQAARLTAGENARLAYYMTRLKQAQESRQLPVTTDQSNLIVLNQVPSMNGHAKPETTVN